MAGIGRFAIGHRGIGRIAQKHQRHPHVLQAQLAVSTAAARWDVAAESAAALRDLQPKDVNWWVTLAYATRRMRTGGLSAAKAVLLKAEKKFPRESIIPYNLACYSCQLGALDEARAYLEKCFTLGDPKQMRKMAANDLDLEILWPELTKK